MNPSEFSTRVTDWQRCHGRHDLPWQVIRDPYRIWVSEIMLQQTQVSTVMGYFFRFMTRFPNLQSLAEADEDEVLAHWSGLGYYARARHLHQAAKQLSNRPIPQDLEGWMALPGVGRSTAGAILTFGFGQRQAILDGNVKRILARVFAISGDPGQKQTTDKFWRLAEFLLPESHPEAYTQGLMDLGASLCRRVRPQCEICPVQMLCRARLEGCVAYYPSPRLRPRIEKIQFRMLILQHRDKLLVERRPTTGIWGGLWCFPTTDREISPVEQFASTQGWKVVVREEWPPIHHALTHRRLIIHPILLDLEKSGMAPGRWISPDEGLGMAMPMPVRRILSSMNSSQ